MEAVPEEFPPSFFTGNMTFWEAGQLIAASPEQWEKLTDPNVRYFCGNWTAKTLLEIVVRYLCQCDDWSDTYSFDSPGIPHGVYHELRGRIAAIARLGLPIVSDLCTRNCNDGGCGDYYFHEIAETARKYFGNDDASISCAFNHVASSRYCAISEDKLALLQKEARRPGKIDATWLATLVNFADHPKENASSLNTNQIIILTPGEIFIDRIDYAMSEISSLKKEEICLIFSHWSEVDAEFHIRVFSTFVHSIQHALELTVSRDYLHEYALINCLLDWLRHHLKNEKPQVRALTYTNLMHTLGIVCGEVIHLTETTGKSTAHPANIKQCIDTRNQRIDIDMF